MPEDIQATAPITITLDVATLARHLVPDYDGEPTGRWEDDEGPPPMGALDGILRHVADLLATDIRKEYVKAAAQHAADSVREHVETIVQGVLDEGGVIGDGYSAKRTKPLRELIRDEVKGVLANPLSTGQRYGRDGREPFIQKAVKDEVTKALKADLAAILEEERARFREAVRTTAAALLADDATRRR
jgi:hypothetical protein